MWNRWALGVRVHFFRHCNVICRCQNFACLCKPEMVDGGLGFVFTDAEMDRVVEELKFAWVLKFLSVRLSIDVLRRHIIKSWGIVEVPMISFPCVASFG